MSRNSLLLVALDKLKDVNYQENYFLSELERQNVAILDNFPNPFSKKLQSEFGSGYKFTPIIIGRAP
jgi:hypothetical protein